jgi:hypothetical protein
MAGTGKSTIANTVARGYFEQGRLAASFIFSRGGGDVGNAQKFVTTIAVQLALHIPPVQRIFMTRLQSVALPEASPLQISGASWCLSRFQSWMAVIHTHRTLWC